MDMRDIFRRFMGFGPGQFPPEREGWNDDLSEHTGDDCPDCGTHNNENEDGFHFFFDHNGRGLEDMFEHFHGDMRRQMEAIHRQMDDMMKGFGAIDFPSVFGPPTIQPSDPNSQGKSGQDRNVFIWSGHPSPFFRHGGERGKTNPRDFMLKEGTNTDDASPTSPRQDRKSRIRTPFGGFLPAPHPRPSTPEKKEDSDLDGKFSEDKILDLIKKPGQESQQPVVDIPSVDRPSMDGHSNPRPRFFSSGRSVTVTTIRGADGKVEQTRRVRDSSGHEESTVTRSLGDKSYTVTTVKEQDGSQERHETFQNMDEKDLGKFEDHWNKRQVHTPSQPAHSMLGPQVPTLDKQDSDLFSKFFGRRK